MVLSRFFQRQQAASAAAAGLGDVAILDDTVVDRRQAATTEEDVTELFRKKKRDQHAEEVQSVEGEEEEDAEEGDEMSVETSNTGDFHRFLADTTDDMTVATSTSNEVMNRIKNDFLKDFIEEKEEEDNAPSTEPVATSRWSWSTRSKAAPAASVSDEETRVERSASNEGAALAPKKATPSWGVGWRTTSKSTDSSQEPTSDAIPDDSKDAEKDHSDESDSSENAGTDKGDIAPVTESPSSEESNPVAPVQPAPQRKGWGWKALAVSVKPGAAATSTGAKPSASDARGSGSESNEDEKEDDTSTIPAPSPIGTAHMPSGEGSDDDEDASEEMDERRSSDDDDDSDSMNQDHNLMDEKDENSSSEESGNSEDDANLEEDDVPPSSERRILQEVSEDHVTPIQPTTQRKGWGWKALTLSAKPSDATVPDAKNASSEEFGKSGSSSSNEEVTQLNQIAGPVGAATLPSMGGSESEDDSDESNESVRSDNDHDDDSENMKEEDGSDDASDESDHQIPSPSSPQQKGWGWNARPGNSSSVDQPTTGAESEKVAVSDDDNESMASSDHDSEPEVNSGDEASSAHDISDNDEESDEHNGPLSVEDSESDEMDMDQSDADISKSSGKCESNAVDDSGKANMEVSLESDVGCDAFVQKKFSSDADELNTNVSGNSPVLPTAQKKGWGWKSIVSTTPNSPIKTIPGFDGTYHAESAMNDCDNKSQLDSSNKESRLAHATSSSLSNSPKLNGEFGINDELDGKDDDEDVSSDERDLDGDQINENDDSNAVNSSYNEPAPPGTQNKGWGWKALVTAKPILAGSTLSPLKSQAASDSDSKAQTVVSIEESQSSSLNAPIRSLVTPSWGAWRSKKPTSADSNHDRDSDDRSDSEAEVADDKSSSAKSDSGSSDDMDADDNSAGKNNLEPTTKTVSEATTCRQEIVMLDMSEQAHYGNSTLLHVISPSALSAACGSDEDDGSDSVELRGNSSFASKSINANLFPDVSTPDISSTLNTETSTDFLPPNEASHSSSINHECDSDLGDASGEDMDMNSDESDACDKTDTDASVNSNPHTVSPPASGSNQVEEFSEENETNSRSETENGSCASEENDSNSEQDVQLDDSQHDDTSVNVESVDDGRRTRDSESINNYDDNTDSDSRDESSSRSKNSEKCSLSGDKSSTDTEDVENDDASKNEPSHQHFSPDGLLSAESMKESSPDDPNIESFAAASKHGKDFELDDELNNSSSRHKELSSSSFSESEDENVADFPKNSIDAGRTMFTKENKSFNEDSYDTTERSASKVISRQLSNESISSSQLASSDAEGNPSNRKETKRGWGWFAKKNVGQTDGVIDNQERPIVNHDARNDKSQIQPKSFALDENANQVDANSNKNDTKRRPWGWFAAKNQDDDSDSESKDDDKILESSDHGQSSVSSHSQSSKKFIDENPNKLKESSHDRKKTDIADANLFCGEIEDCSARGENLQRTLPNDSQPDSDESFSMDSNSDDESKNNKPYRLVVKQAPLLRLENVTAATRSKIPDDRDQKKDKTWWFSKKNENGDKSAPLSKGEDLKSSGNHLQQDTSGQFIVDQISDENDDYPLNFEEISRNTLMNDISKNDAAISSTKTRKKKKSKGSDISTLMEKNKSTRKVNSHGDEVSVGTLNFKVQEASRVVVLSRTNALLDESELGPRNRPWERTIRKGPKRPHSSLRNPSPLDDINVLSADIEMLFNLDPLGNAQDAPSKKDAKGNPIIHLPSLHEEDESDDNDDATGKRAVLDGIMVTENSVANDDKVDKPLEMTDMEQRLLESTETVEIDFDQMWDDVSCDGSTALEFERIKRKKNHEKERKRQRREKEKSEKENAARRLRLFERRKERSDSVHPALKKASEMQSKLSDEFVDAIHKVFDEGSVNSVASSVEHSTDGVDFMEEGSANGSCYSIYLQSEASQNEEEDKSQSSGNNLSKNQRNDSRVSIADVSDDEMRTVSSLLRKEDHKGKRLHSKKSNARKGKKRSKRSEIDSSEIFLAEVERLKKPKIFTVASLKQEMIDRRGTSVNFLKKEYVNYRKKRIDRRKGSLDNELKPLDFGALSEQMKNKKDDKKVDVFDSVENKSDSGAGGLGAKLSRWVATEGVTELDDLATVVENPTPTHNIFGAAAALAKNAASMIPEVPSNQEIQALARDAGKGISSAGTTILTGGQALGSNVAHVGERVGRTVGSNLGQGVHVIADGINQGTHSLGKGLSKVSHGIATTTTHLLDSHTEPIHNQSSDDDMNLFTANFSDMPLTSIQEMEDDDDDDFGLLASHKRGRDDDSDKDDDDAQSLGIRSAGGNRMQFKMGKIKAPKLGKTIKKLVPKLPSMNMRGDGGSRNGGFRMSGSNKGYGGMGLLD